MGVPGDRLDVLPHYLPAEAFAERSRADQGSYALVASRLSPGEGHRCGHRGRGFHRHPAAGGGGGTGGGGAAERSRSAGERPWSSRAVCERASLARELAGAAMVLMPSRYHEFSPYSALEAMAAGVPVVASASAASESCSERSAACRAGDAAALAARMTALWESPGSRRSEGDELIAKARAEHGEERYVSRLLEIYTRARQ